MRDMTYSGFINLLTPDGLHVVDSGIGRVVETASCTAAIYCLMRGSTLLACRRGTMQQAFAVIYTLDAAAADIKEAYDQGKPMPQVVDLTKAALIVHNASVMLASSDENHGHLYREGKVKYPWRTLADPQS